MSKIKIKESEREISVSKFGTWFPKNATPEQIITKCNARLASMEEWMKNTTILKQEQEVLILEQKKADMKKTVVSMSAEEKAELLTLLKAE